MNIITSRSNPAVMLAKKLHTAKERLAHGLFMAEGINTCLTLLQSKRELSALYFTKDTLQALEISHGREFFSAFRALTTIVTDSVMACMSDTVTPSGMLGIFKIPPTPDRAFLKPGVIFAEISDPGNMGTLMRTVAAIGIPSIIVIEGADPWSPKVVRASAGSIAHVSLFQMSWQECVQVTKHVPLYALTPKNGNPLVTAKNMREGFLVIGNEAHGIRQEWLADCTDRIALPMPGNAESLNAAVAGSIALYRAYVP